MTRFIGRIAIGILVAALLTVGSTPPVCAKTNLIPVTLRMDIFFNGAHVPLIAGIVDGIYKKHGLDVTALPGQGSATTIQTVANGSDDFGFADGGTLIRLAAQGVSAKEVVGILQLNPMVVLAMPNAHIAKPSDLNGKTGGFSAASSPEQLFTAFAGRNGIDPNSVKRIVVDIPTRDSMFLARKTDFSFGYSVSQLPLLEEKCRCRLVVFRYSELGVPSVSNGIVVSTKFATQKPEVVKRFAQATAEAIAAAVKNPQHAVDDFFAYAKDTPLSRDVVTKQWSEAQKLLHTKATAGKPYGVMDAGDWQKTIDLLVQFANVPKGSVLPEAVFTNEFLSK